MYLFRKFRIYFIPFLSLRILIPNNYDKQYDIIGTGIFSLLISYYLDAYRV